MGLCGLVYRTPKQNAVASFAVNGLSCLNFYVFGWVSNIQKNGKVSKLTIAASDGMGCRIYYTFLQNYTPIYVFENWCG